VFQLTTVQFYLRNVFTFRFLAVNQVCCQVISELFLVIRHHTLEQHKTSFLIPYDFHDIKVLLELFDCLLMQLILSVIIFPGEAAEVTDRLNWLHIHAAIKIVLNNIG
jgi:hypothetical protein